MTSTLEDFRNLVSDFQGKVAGVDFTEKDLSPIDRAACETARRLAGIQAAIFYTLTKHTFELAVENCPVCAEISQHDALRAEVELLRDMVTWMSGSPSFGPEGEAHSHWVEQRDKWYALRRSQKGE